MRLTPWLNYTFLSLLFLDAYDVAARAGGGQHYASTTNMSGGGSSSGGSGFGGSTIIAFGIMAFVAYRCYKSENFRNKLFSSVSVGKGGFKLNIGGLVFDEAHKLVAQKTGKDIDSIVMNTFRMQNNFIAAKIQTVDTAFNEAAFVERAKKAFLTVQSAWSQGKLNHMRAFVTDGVYERFAVQADALKKRGLQNRIENIKVMSCALAHAEFEGAYSYLTLEIRAIGNDKTFDEQGKVVSEEDAAFTENWTFLRKKHAQTTSKPGLLEGSCPCCSAPLEVNQNAKCESCGALTRSGEYDWVLSEITQEGEQVANNGFSFEQSALAKRDPEACSQLVEDTASVMFWRLIRAKTEADTAFIKKCASAKFESKVKRDHKIESFDHAAIGSVEVSALVEDTERKMDLCFVDLVWSAKDVGHANASKRKSSLVLARKASAAAQGSAGYGVTFCHGCGSPEDGAAHNACPYCGYVFNDGSKEWVMIDFVADAARVNRAGYLNDQADDLSA